MNAYELASEVTKWVERYGFVPYVSKRRAENNYLVELTVITTMTRASSMVTRLLLLSSEIAGESRFSVRKELVTEAPTTRDSLATWKITVAIPIKVRSKVA